METPSQHLCHEDNTSKPYILTNIAPNIFNKRIMQVGNSLCLWEGFSQTILTNIAPNSIHLNTTKTVTDERKKATYRFKIII